VLGPVFFFFFPPPTTDRPFCPAVSWIFMYLHPFPLFSSLLICLTTTVRSLISVLPPPGVKNVKWSGYPPSKTFAPSVRNTPNPMFFVLASPIPHIAFLHWPFCHYSFYSLYDRFDSFEVIFFALSPCFELTTLRVAFVFSPLLNFSVRLFRNFSWLFFTLRCLPFHCPTNLPFSCSLR